MKATPHTALSTMLASGVIAVGIALSADPAPVAPARPQPAVAAAPASGSCPVLPAAPDPALPADVPAPPLAASY